MNDILQQHEEALALAEEAERLNQRGALPGARSFYREAMRADLVALELCKEQNLGIKNLALLYRSAASFALSAGEVAHARTLIASALALGPPSSLETDLRALLANAERLPALRGAS
jgi:hypothetical protein